MILSKSTVNVALTGLNEKVASEAADASVSLSVCENVQFIQGGVPQTRHGYAEVTSMSYTDGTVFDTNEFATRSAAFVGDNGYYVTSDQCRALRYTGTLSSPIRSFSPMVVQTQVGGVGNAYNGARSNFPKTITRCAPRKIANVRHITSQEQTGARSYDSPEGDSIVGLSDAYHYHGHANFPEGILVVVTTPTQGTSLNVNSAIPLFIVSVVDCATGKVLNQQKSSQTIYSGGALIPPEAMCVVGYGSTFAVVMAGHVSASPATVTAYYSTISDTVMPVFSSTTVATDFQTGGLMSASYDDTHATANRVYIKYHSTTTAQTSTIIRRLSTTDFSSLASATDNDDGFPPAGADFDAFGLYYDVVADEVVSVNCYSGTLAATLIKCRSADLASTYRGGATAWNGVGPYLNAVMYLSRVSIRHYWDDSLGSARKCFGLIGCITVAGTKAYDTWVQWAQFGQGSTYGGTSVDTILSTSVDAPQPQVILSSALVARPWCPMGQTRYFSLVPICHVSDLAVSAGIYQSHCTVYRVDGRSNVTLAFGGATDSPLPLYPNTSSRFPVACQVATGTLSLLTENINVASGKRSKRLSFVPVSRSSSSPPKSFFCCGIVDNTAFTARGSVYAVSASGIPAAPQSVAVYSMDHTMVSMSSTSGTAGDIASCGYPYNVDGGRLSEAHTPAAPVIYGSSPIAGLAIILVASEPSIQYRAMWEYEMESGNVMWSELSNPHTVDVTVPGNCTSIEVRIVPPVTSLTSPVNAIRCHLFRRSAISGGDRYVGTAYFANSTAFTAANYVSIFDTIGSSSIASMPAPYYDPTGVGSGSPLPRQRPAGLRKVIHHADRQFGIDEDGSIRFTGPLVTGENPWWSDAFSIPVPGGGQAEALASYGGRLFVLKRDSVYVIDGQGPPENGGNGSEFSAPQLVSGTIGISDPRALVVTPYGIIFRSQRGLEMLTPNGGVDFIGEQVQLTLDQYPYTVAAAYDPDADCVKFLVSSLTEPSYGYVSGTSGGAIFCMYGKAQSWAVHKVAAGGVSDSNFCDMRVVNFNGRAITCLLSADGKVYVEKKLHSSGNYLDPSGSPVAVKLATHWVKLGNAVNSRFRLYDCEMIGIKATNHAVTMKIYYNYSSSVGITKTWQPPYTDATPEVLQVQPNVQQVISAKLEVSYSAPSDTGTYPVTTGEGTKILQLAMNIGVQDGLPRIPADQKG